MATNTRSKGKNAPPGAFPASSSSPSKSAGGRSSSSRPAPSSLPSSSSNTPSNLSDVQRNTSNFRNLNINGAALSSAAHSASESEDDGGAQYEGQQHQGRASSKLEGAAIPITTGTNAGEARASFVPQDPPTNLDSWSKNCNRRQEGAPHNQRGRAKDGWIVVTTNFHLTSSSNTTRHLQPVSS